MHYCIYVHILRCFCLKSAPTGALAYIETFRLIAPSLPHLYACALRIFLHIHQEEQVIMCLCIHHTQHTHTHTQAVRFGEECSMISNHAAQGAVSVASAAKSIDEALAMCQQGLRSLGQPLHLHVQHEYANFALNAQLCVYALRNFWMLKPWGGNKKQNMQRRLL
jgi:hypothetical protein